MQSYLPCCVACKCEGKEGKCERVAIIKPFTEEEDSDESEVDM